MLTQIKGLHQVTPLRRMRGKVVRVSGATVVSVPVIAGQAGAPAIAS